MRTRILRITPLAILILAALACNVNVAGNETAPTLTPMPPEQATEVVDPPADTPTEETQPNPPADATEEPADNPSPAIPPEGAFITTPNDSVADLPTLSVPPVGIGGVFCEGATNGSTSFRSITREFGLLCLYGLNTEVGAPAITVTVVAPDGTSYGQTYNIFDDGGNLALFDPHGNRGGSVYAEDFVGSPDFKPAVGLDFFTGAYLPAGQWTVSATTADNSVSIPPTPFLIERTISLVSDAPIPGFSPLDHSRPRYSAGDTIYFYGAAYVPGQTIRLILYTNDPGGATDDLGGVVRVPRNATTITVDANGRFEAQFVVGTATLSGDYYAITDDQFDADFEASGFMRDPFVGAFAID